jgi:hypothetical protein
MEKIGLCMSGFLVGVESAGSDEDQVRPLVFFGRRVPSRSLRGRLLPLHRGYDLLARRIIR